MNPKNDDIEQIDSKPTDQDDPDEYVPGPQDHVSEADDSEDAFDDEDAEEDVDADEDALDEDLD